MFKNILAQVEHSLASTVGYYFLEDLLSFVMVIVSTLQDVKPYCTIGINFAGHEHLSLFLYAIQVQATVAVTNNDDKLSCLLQLTSSLHHLAASNRHLDCT